LKTALQCLPCMVNSYVRLVEHGIIPPAFQQDIIRDVLQHLATTSYDQSPPELARTMQRNLRVFLNDPDPYKTLKTHYNQILLTMYDELQTKVTSSSFPFITAMRMAIAGNVIDFAAKHQLNIKESIEKVVHANLAIDDSIALQRDIEKAESVLYIGDNAGEIVLDKLFIETIAHKNLTFAVREQPVLNDATRTDAKETGLDTLCDIITTGDDSPGVILETSSATFLQHFNNADVVIAKGQGNLEGLIDCHRTVYFLFVAKCEYMADRIGVPVKSFVVMKGIQNEEK